ncbi:ricin-type beta-trefoil lectin domain protein [Streptomyces griseocarneus]|uniref:ricin-type beta-trefoil lectin domain protein n=1 Tax=Streptomyces griseocarneus TaxID=51201 RepID=UPI00167EDCC0|nr:ricin-type beta-trefoil lectin domain protein [Streptomyces griseocarneus]MBZ6477894.1 ricin-type beta-trefoil lectin domain protein [Streptomyces griseocarneus]
MAGGDRRDSNPARQLGNALRALQRRSGRTLRSLEDDVPTSDSSLSRYFCGSTVPPWGTVRALCQVLGADPMEYRTLWEAANRSQARPFEDAGQAEGPAEGPAAGPSDGPAVEAVGEPADKSADDPADDSADDSAEVPAPQVRRRRGSVRTRLRGRWAYAAAGTVAGFLLGAALTSLTLRPEPASTLGSRTTQAAGKEGHAPQHAVKLSDDVRIFVSRTTGRCLDDSIDKKLRSYDCNGMSYQRWTVHPFPDGTRQLRNHATGACLADGDAGLRAVPCSTDASAAQTWTVTTWPDQAVELKSKATGACLDDDGDAGLRALPCDRSRHQQWG